MAITYKIGQILVSNENMEVRRGMSNEKVIIPKGNKIIIGPDKFAHHILTGMIQSLGEAEVKGYDPEGLAEYLAQVLITRLPNAETLKEYDVTKEILYDEIELALEDIGF